MSRCGFSIRQSKNPERNSYQDGFKGGELPFSEFESLDQRMNEALGNAELWAESSVNRFVVLRHDVGPCFERTPEAHLDWMFATGKVLSTWTTELITDFDDSFDVTCMRLADHRSIYLDREGDLGGGRGSVRRVLVGQYTLLASDLPEVTFKAALRWSVAAGVRFGLLEIIQRRDEKVSEAEPVLALRFAACR